MARSGNILAIFHRVYDLYRPYPNSARTISRILTLKKELKYLKGENNRRELDDMLAKLKNFISKYGTSQ
ncbi:MAG: hypothetical protein WCA61_09085 [Nitrososphaeraceae archaeon]